MSTNEIKLELIKKLKQTPEGKLPSDLENEVLSYMEDNWDSMGGNADSTSMAGRKVRRADQITLTHPATLSFTVERHGGFMLGSKYAENQNWTCDLVNDHVSGGDTCRGRAIIKLDKRLDVKPLAENVAKLILSHNKDSGLLVWNSEYDVRVKTTNIIPKTNIQTTSARRKRFRQALKAILSEHGLQEISPSRFRRETGNGRQEK